MRLKLFVCTALAAVASPIAAQDQAAPAVDPAVEKELADRSVRIFSLMAAAMNEESLSADQKNALMRCMYANSFRKLSEVAGDGFKQNPQLDKANDQHLFAIIATMCGARGQENAAPAAPAAGDSR